MRKGKRVDLAAHATRGGRKGFVVRARGPYWVGDEGPTDELMSVVYEMLLERPLRFQELLEATGARDNRIKGVIMRLQREGVRVVDVARPGTGKALWFIPSDAALARIRKAVRR